MKSKKNVGIGMIGCGNIGAAFVDILAERSDELEAVAGVRPGLKRIAVASLSKSRPERVRAVPLTDKAEEIVRDRDVDVVVELMGGVEPARTYLLEAIRNGKSVVTGNKELIAAASADLVLAAKSANVDLRYEAAAMAAVPVLGMLRDPLSTEKITQIIGILNGTSNYILTRMSEEALSFDSALLEAKRLGFAEPDPSADIRGFDAAAKLAILSTLASKRSINFASVETRGIDQIEEFDIRTARALGYEVKLIGLAKLNEANDESWWAGVFPAFVARSHPLSAVRDTFNAVCLSATDAGELMLSGRGAGPRETASAIIGDLALVVRNKFLGVTSYSHIAPPARIGDADSVRCPYYIRVELVDKPGAIGEVAGAFGAQGVSLRVVEQHHVVDQVAHVIFITHETTQSVIDRSCDVIKGRRHVIRVSQRMRVIGAKQVF
jgi:homoserine dehydrogenase